MPNRGCGKHASCRCGICAVRRGMGGNPVGIPGRFRMLDEPAGKREPGHVRRRPRHAHGPVLLPPEGENTQLPSGDGSHVVVDAIEESRARLIAGVRRFEREIYPQRKAAYWQAVSEGQKAHALFITCADSRIDPELVTQSGPGDLFVSRNIGNLVPPYGEMLGGVSAIIEYAVAALR